MRITLSAFFLSLICQVAFAGANATYDNPSDLAELDHPQLAGGWWGYFPSYTFHGSSTASGFPITGGERRTSAPLIFPSAFFASPFTLGSHQWVYGLGITRPMHLNDDENYPEGNIGRYNSTRESYQTNTLVAALATKWGKDWALGAALNLNQLNVHYDVDRSAFPLPDAHLHNEGNGIGVSVGLSAHYLHRETGSYASLLYRTPSAIPANGNSQLTMPDGTQYTGHRFSMTAPLPPELEFKAVQYLNQNTYAAFIYHYTWWDRVDTLLFKNMRLDPSNPNTDENLWLNFNWKNIDSYTLAVHHQFNDQWGATPSFTRINSKESQGSYYTILGLTGSYQATPALGVSATYLRALKQTTRPTAVSSSVAFNGYGTQTAHYIGLDFTYDIDKPSKD